MKSFNLLLCVFVLSAICAAEETEYLDWKANKLYSSKNYTEALTYFDQAISQDQNYLSSWVGKGNTQKALKDYNGSIQSYSRALELDPMNAVASSGIVDAYLAAKDYDNATNAISRAKEANPSNKGIWLKSGNLLMSNGDYEAAVAEFDGALAIDSQYKDRSEERRGG